MPTIDANTLQAFAEAILEAAGLGEEDARVTAECLILANLRGVDSHGVLRLIQYSDSLAAGEINPTPNVRVIQRRGATALVDADGGYGFRPSRLAMELAVELAGEVGIGIVGVRNSHHFGMGAIYPLEAAAKGAIGYITTTSSPILAPPGGKQPVVGNNPIAWAVPRRAPNPPIVLDMALSQVAFGRIRLAAAEGRPIPLGWAYDSRGLPTTDAAEALRTGLLAPVGGHKGYGISVISELLAGVMTGSPFGLQSDAHSRRQGGVGHLLIAIRPDFFLDLETFYDGVEELVAQIKAVPLAEGADAVYLPGEIEWNTEQVRRREGIPISDELAHKLGSLAQRLGVEVPAWS